MSGLWALTFFLSGSYQPPTRWHGVHSAHCTLRAHKAVRGTFPNIRKVYSLHGAIHLPIYSPTQTHFNIVCVCLVCVYTMERCLKWGVGHVSFSLNRREYKSCLIRALLVYDLSNFTIICKEEKSRLYSDIILKYKSGSCFHFFIYFTYTSEVALGTQRMLSPKVGGVFTVKWIHDFYSSLWCFHSVLHMLSYFSFIKDLFLVVCVCVYLCSSVCTCECNDHGGQKGASDTLGLG